MDLTSALETSFSIVERLEDRRVALKLFQCASHLNDLFISPERVSRYAHLMRNETLKLRDIIELKRELDESRVAVTRALSRLLYVARQDASKISFPPSQLAALNQVIPAKMLVRTEIDDLLCDYAWHRAVKYPDLGPTAEAAALFGFDANSPPPFDLESLSARATAQEDAAKRLSAAIDGAFDCLTSGTARRAPLGRSHFVAAAIGGVVIFGVYTVVGAFLEPYLQQLFAWVRDWLAIPAG